MTDEILTFEEARNLLKLGRNKMLKLLQSGKITASKIGRDWRITRKAIDEYLEKTRFVPISEKEKDRLKNERMKHIKNLSEKSGKITS